MQSEPDTDKQDALIKAFNDNAKDSDGNQIDYVKMPGEDGTKSYYDPTGAINAKVAAIRAGTDFKDASTAHVKAVTAIIPQQLKMAQQRLAVSQDNLKLAQGKWADSSQNPESIYYGITPPKSAGDTKQIDKLTQKAVTASNDAGKFSRAADSYFATMQATKEAWEQAHSGDKWETGDSVNYNQMQRQLDMLHQQTLEANDRTTRYNDELKDLAKTMAGLQGNQTLRSVNGKPPPTTTGNASGGQNGQNGQNPPAGNTQTPAKATAQPRIRPVPGGTGLTIDTVTGEIFKNGQSTGHRIKV